MERRGWYYYDFLIVTGDAYVDHPSFGPPSSARAGSRGLPRGRPGPTRLAQPADFEAMGRPRYGAMVSSGISIPWSPTTPPQRSGAAKILQPGKEGGLRPDRAVIVYSNRLRSVRDLPVVIGGLEASLRRFAHYDYWEDAVRRSVLFDAKADLLIYGMGERASGRPRAPEAGAGTSPASGSCFRASVPTSANLNTSYAPPARRSPRTRRRSPGP